MIEEANKMTMDEALALCKNEARVPLIDWRMKTKGGKSEGAFPDAEA